MISTVLSVLFLALSASASPAPNPNPAPTPTASYGCYEPHIAYGSPTLASVSYRSPCPTPCGYSSYPYNNCYNNCYDNCCSPYRTSECVSVNYPCNDDCYKPHPTVIASYSAVPCGDNCGYNCNNECGYRPYGYNNGPYNCGYNGYNCGNCYDGNCGKVYIPPVTFTTKTVATKTDLITIETRVPVPVPVYNDCNDCYDCHHDRVRVRDYDYAA